LSFDADSEEGFASLIVDGAELESVNKKCKLIFNINKYNIVRAYLEPGGEPPSGLVDQPKFMIELKKIVIIIYLRWNERQSFEFIEHF